MYGSQMGRINKGSKAIKRIIIINIIVFLIANIFVSYFRMNGGGEGFLPNLALSSDIVTILTKPWTLITSMFMHIDFMHILFNMLYLYWFGKILQESYGGQAVVSSFILGGLVGAIFYIMFYQLLMPSGIGGLAIGASGGVTSIMVASAAINPERRMNLFLIGPVKIKWVVLVLFILSSVINFHENTGGKVDHIGGAVFGLIFAMNLKRGKNIAGWFDRMMTSLAKFFHIKTTTTYGKDKSYGFRGAMDKRPKEFRERTAKNFKNNLDEKKEMDRLLDKISKKGGYKKLSKDEQERLKQLSQKY